jgi:glutaredoxin-related protein
LDALAADIQAFKEARDNILADQELSQEFKDYVKNTVPSVFITWGSS